MRRRGLLGPADLEILVWGLSVESSVRSEVVVEVLEGTDMLGDLFDVVWQVDDGIEFVSPSAVASFDGTIELWRPRRQDIEGDGLCGTGLFELGHELGAPVHLDRLDRPWHFGDNFVEEVGGVAGGGVEIGLGNGPLCMD